MLIPLLLDTKCIIVYTVKEDTVVLIQLFKLKGHFLTVHSIFSLP